MKPSKPILHGRDHGPGGADPVPFPAGGIQEITSTDGSVAVTDPTGPITDLSVSGFIQFDVNPQSGGYLEVETTTFVPTGGKARGIVFKTTRGMLVEQEVLAGISNPIALSVYNALDARLSTMALYVEAVSAYASGSASALVTGGFFHIESPHGGGVGITTEVIAAGTTTFDVLGAQCRAFPTDVGNGIGLYAASSSNSGTHPYSLGMHAYGLGQSSQTASAGGVFEAHRDDTSPNPSRATVMAKALPSNGILSYARAKNNDVAGLIIDVGIQATGSGTAYPIRAWSGGIEVFRVDDDGTVHILTGSTFVADL